MDTNIVVVAGRLTRDPDISFTQSQKQIAKLRIAINGFKQDDVSFFNITAWEKTAEICGKYLHKGSQIVVSGKLNQNTFIDKNGNNRSSVDIIANQIQFVGGKQESQTNDNDIPTSIPEWNNENGEPISGDAITDDVPF